MALEQWIVLLFLGGLVGAIGQGIRAAAGLKKVNDAADALKTSFSALFSTSTLIISLIIGFIAGALGALSLWTAGQIAPSGPISGQTIITLLGIGYAGTDFIEAFMAKHGPELGSSGAYPAAAPAAPPVNSHDVDNAQPSPSSAVG